MDRDNSHVVVDHTYYEDEEGGNRIYAGTYEKCLDFIVECGGLGMEIEPSFRRKHETKRI